MPVKILVTRKINSHAIEMLQSHFETVYIDKNEQLDTDYLKRNLYKFDGILTTITEKIDIDILHAGNGKLKVVSNMAAGLDNIDLYAAHLLGIQIFNVPDVVTDSTADFAIGLALAFLRKIPESKQYVLNNGWHQWDPEIFNGRSLSQLNWGIIGFGRIGKAVAKRLRGFGTKTFYTDEQGRYVGNEFGATYLDEDTLLSVCDVISLHVPLNVHTMHMINKSAFLKMGKKPLLINIARGDIIDTQELIYALEKGLISGAVLDVVENEPIDSNHPLLRFNNVLITPHIGTATIECRKQMAEKAVGNLIDFFENSYYNERELERYFF